MNTKFGNHWSHRPYSAPADIEAQMDRMPTTPIGASYAARAPTKPAAAEQKPPERLLNTVEAAEYLRLSARTLERYRVTGGGPRYVKLGPGKRARVVYREADLVDWLDQSVFESTSEYEG